MTDRLTATFILGYFPINQPCQQPASAFCSFHCTLWSKILHWLLNATKISLFWSQTTHVQELTVVFHVPVPCRRQNYLFHHRESGRAPVPWLPMSTFWPKTEPTCRLSPWSQVEPIPCPHQALGSVSERNGEYKMLRRFQGSKLAPSPA